MENLHEIPIHTIDNIKIGHAQDVESGTGCTVFISENGAPTGIDIRGGGPASRETALLNPLAASDRIHAVLLAGGSAFGLDAAGGVMTYLSEHDIGYDTGYRKVPLVCASCIYDLIVGDALAMPDKAMAYEACENAFAGSNLQHGNAGVGTGATVGKLFRAERLMKSGFGSYALQIGELQVGAAVCVNAFGDIFDESGHQIAGLLNAEKVGLTNTVNAMLDHVAPVENRFTGNTTLGVIVTNARFDKIQMNKIAAMGQNALARRINPVHTSADGDSVYAMSTGNVSADSDLVGTLGTQVLETAIVKAVLAAEPAYDLKVARDFR